MAIPALTHIWMEINPISDVKSLIPDGMEIYWRESQADSAVESAQAAQAILASSLLQYNGDLFDQLPNLKMVCRTGIGIDNLDLEAATERGIVCCHTPDGPTQATAEHTVAMILALSRRLKQGNDNLAAGKWGPRQGVLIGNEVQNKTLGVVGLGRIGRKVAQICRLGLEMNVVGYDPFVTQAQMDAMGLEMTVLDDMEAVIAQSDFLTVHVPATPETYHLINAERIASMKDGSYVVNLARGPLVDGAALLDAVDSGKLAGAGLDVFEPEPPAVESRLRNHPNIIATPHIGGVTVESRTRMEAMALERVLAYFRGERPENVVNPAVFG